MRESVAGGYISKEAACLQPSVQVFCVTNTCFDILHSDAASVSEWGKPFTTLSARGNIKKSKFSHAYTPWQKAQDQRDLACTDVMEIIDNPLHHAGGFVI